MNGALGIIFLLSLSTAAQACDLDLAEVTSRASLDQLAAISNVLRVRLDGVDVCPAELGPLDPSEMAQLPQRLEAEIRSQLSAMLPPEKKEFFRDEKRAKFCEARCRCETYAAWIGEGPARIGEGPEWEVVRKNFAVRGATARRSSSYFARCAKANESWACHHRVMRALIREGRPGVISSTPTPGTS